MMLVPDANTEPQLVESTRTIGAGRKPVPLIVMIPPDVDPDEGEIEVILGAGSYVNPFVRDAVCKFELVTVTVTAPWACDEVVHTI